MGAFKKLPEVFQNHNFWQIFCRMCHRRIFCFKILKSFKLRFSLEKQVTFFWKSLTFRKMHLFGQFNIESVSNYVFTEDFCKSSRVWFFGKIDVFFSKKCTEFFENAKVHFFSRIHLNLYNDRTALKTFELWGFFWKNGWVVRVKMLSFFKTA